MRDTTVVFAGANFLGCKLISKLLKAGNTTVAIDSLKSASTQFLSRFDDTPHFKRTVVPPETNPPAFNLQNIKAVFYLGIPTCFRGESLRPLQLMDINTRFTGMALELAALADVPCIIVSQRNTCDFPGQYSCRARLSAHLQTEAANFAEALARQNRNARGTNVQIVRVYNCFGKLMNCGCSPIPAFAAQAAAGGPVTLFDYGTDMHSFTFSDDVANALIRIPDSNASLLLNLANPNLVSTFSLAQKITNFFHNAEIVSIKSDSPQQHQAYSPDISHAVSTINWNPDTPFDIALNDTLISLSSSFKPCFGNN